MQAITVILNYVRQYALYIIVAIVAFSGGYYVHSPATVAVVQEKPVVHEQIITKTQTQVEYVPKEVVVYRDAQTGQTSIKPEKTDIEVITPKTDLNVTVNGKPMTIHKTDDETQVLDKNKLVVTNTSSADLHIEIPVVRVDDTKNWQFGGMVGTDGLSVVGGYKNWLGQVEWKYNGGYEVAAGWAMRF